MPALSSQVIIFLKWSCDYCWSNPIKLLSVDNLLSFFSAFFHPFSYPRVCFITLPPEHGLLCPDSSFPVRSSSNANISSMKLVWCCPVQHSLAVLNVVPSSLTSYTVFVDITTHVLTFLLYYKVLTEKMHMLLLCYPYKTFQSIGFIDDSH